MLDVIKNRCSVRNFDLSKTPTEEQIFNVLEAGRLAPSWVNTQPWHFIVIRDEKTRALVSKLAPNQAHLAAAPVIIACLCDLNCFSFENYRTMLQNRPGMTEEGLLNFLNSETLNPALKGQETVKLRVMEELTYAIAYMTLEVHNQGLGCCIIGAIGNEFTGSLGDVYSVVREELAIPDNVYLGTLLAVGCPAEGAFDRPKNRKNFEDVVSFEKYKQ